MAELCGWTKHIDASDTECVCHWFSHKAKDNAPSAGHLPDYLNDLNAMHEAEMLMTEEQGCRYRELLFLVVKASPEHDNDRGVGYPVALCHATAAQRAEAFVHTKGA